MGINSYSVIGYVHNPLIHFIFCGNRNCWRGVTVELNAITNQVNAGQNQCANPETSANLQYEVVEALQPEPNSEPEITTLPASASFAWPATPGATVYELRLKQTTQKQMVHSSQFVARMLLPYDTQTTALSSEIVEHMHPGTEYEWQVFALDHHGDVIHQTQPQYFVFMP